MTYSNVFYSDMIRCNMVGNTAIQYSVKICLFICSYFNKEAIDFILMAGPGGTLTATH